MGPDRNKHLRNIAIILLIAAAVWLLPGGDTGTRTVSNLLSLIFLGALCFFAYRMYMEHRITLLDLDDRARLILYGSFALACFAIVAARRFWGEGGLGALVWMILAGLAIYGVVLVYRRSREY